MNMNIKTIRELAGILQNANLTALELEEGETRIRLEKNAPAQIMQAPLAASLPSMPQQEAAVSPVSAPLDDPGLDFNAISLVTSPMVGVFYAAPAPDQEPFVKVGSKVKKGDVLCIIEAMKLMNEITAEQDGEVVDICVHSGDVVEFGQPLFKIF